MLFLYSNLSLKSLFKEVILESGELGSQKTYVNEKSDNDCEYIFVQDLSKNFRQWNLSYRTVSDIDSYCNTGFNFFHFAGSEKALKPLVQ